MGDAISNNSNNPILNARLNNKQEQRKLRCFVAVEIPKNYYPFLYDIQKRFDLICKKTNVSSFHLTLSFLGNIDLNDIPKIIILLKNIKFKPFFIELSKLHYFLSRKNPSALFLGVESSGLLELQKLVCIKLNVFEERDFCSAPYSF